MKFIIGHFPSVSFLIWIEILFGLICMAFLNKRGLGAKLFEELYGGATVGLP